MMSEFSLGCPEVTVDLKGDRNLKITSLDDGAAVKYEVPIRDIRSALELVRTHGRVVS